MEESPRQAMSARLVMLIEGSLDPLLEKGRFTPALLTTRSRVCLRIKLRLADEICKPR